MDISESIILGIIQGLTEWLPISSSGHLVLANKWMGMAMPVSFGVILHLSTALVIIVMFKNDIKTIIKSVTNPKLPGDPKKRYNSTKNPGKSPGYWQCARTDPQALFGWWIIVGSMPIAFIGMLFYETFEVFFSSVIIVGIALIGSGLALAISSTVIKTAHKKQMNALDAYTIGLGQGLALIPGFSRSGLTISFGLLRNVERETVARYSILLAVPAIIGAAIWETPGMINGGTAGVPPLALLVGGVTAFVVGYVAIKLLLFIVKKAGLHFFALYCFGLGVIIISTV
ncbi:MAG: undecaprenyl-diphosphate phosphatase [Thermoplasmata archaeon]|nr:MAG: undecaprenyl-diphosphate phosphatase [Thermoplasmata archaeon]